MEIFLLFLLYQSYFNELGLPIMLTELKIPSDKFDLMAGKAVAKGPIGNFIKLGREDVLKIYELAK